MNSSSLLLDFLLALGLGFVVTQVSIVVTSVWLHRSLAHKSLTVNGPVTARVPLRDLDHDRDEAP